MPPKPIPPFITEVLHYTGYGIVFGIIISLIFLIVITIWGWEYQTNPTRLATLATEAAPIMFHIELESGEYLTADMTSFTYTASSGDTPAQFTLAFHVVVKKGTETTIVRDTEPYVFLLNTTAYNSIQTR